MELFLERQQRLLALPLPGRRFGQADTGTVPATVATGCTPSLSTMPVAPVLTLENLPALRDALTDSFVGGIRAAFAGVVASSEATDATLVKAIAHASRIQGVAPIATSGRDHSLDGVDNDRTSVAPVEPVAPANLPPEVAPVPQAALDASIPCVPATESDAATSSVGRGMRLGDSITIRIQPHRIFIQLLEREMLPIVICGRDEAPNSISGDVTSQTE